MNLELQTVESTPETEEEITPAQRVARLERGDHIAVHEIERMFRVTRDTPEYSTRCLQLKGLVEAEWLRRDPPMHVAVKIDSDVGVMLLTASGASAYSTKTSRNGRRKLRRALAIKQDVPRSELASDEVVAHDRDLEVQGRVVSAVNRELRRKIPEPRPRERSTPVAASRK